MTGDLSVQTDGVRSYAQMHEQVAAGLSQLMGAGAPDAIGVQTSHGTIASAVNTALSSVLGSRHGTMQTTATTGDTIRELLQKAAALYERGDEEGGDKITAAAEALQNAEGDGAAGGGSPGGASPGGAQGGAAQGGDMVGQMLGQAGQLIGSLTQPLQGLMQSATQLPQQAMQGIQQAVGAAAQGGSESAELSVDDKPEREEKERGSDSTEDQTPSSDSAATGAAPGQSAGTGRAPEAPPVEEAQRPQTRPAD
jgi:hypothetical protein